MEKKKQIILITIGVILYFFANIQRVAIPGAVFDLLQRDLNASAPYITALGSAFMYIYAICQLFIGISVDRFGGTRVITFGSIFFFVGAILFPISNSLPLLYLSRILVGIGSSTIYLSLINEIKNTFSSKNFGLMLSVALFVGYMGGIFANAPFVLCVDKFGWREVLLFIGILTAAFSLLFIFVGMSTEKKKINKKVKFNLEPFKKVLQNKHNINLFIFAGVNYGIYYVLQTVIGLKFIEDFCGFSVNTAALILSCMAGLYSVSGPVFAFLSKALYTRKAVFLKLVGCLCFSITGLISIFLLFNINTKIIAMLMLILAFSASLSPLLVPLIHDTNKKEITGTAVSMMTCMFYIFVGLFGNLTGILMNVFPPEKMANGVLKYNSHSYLLIFAVLFGLSIISLYNVFKLSDSIKTKRLLHIRNIHNEKEQISYVTH